MLAAAALSHTAMAQMADVTAAPVINAGGPVITYASPIEAKRTQTITIKGSNFGTQAPYSGFSPYIFILDITRAWSAGLISEQVKDTVGLKVTKWADDEIVIKGFVDDYGGNGGEFVLKNGDLVLFLVGNPTENIMTWIGDWTLDKAPSACVVVVGSGYPCTGAK